MASTEIFLETVLEQLDELKDIRSRKMMGEYLLYYKDKLFGGIYDDRLLLKPVDSAIAYFDEPVYEEPYDGAKPMLIVNITETRENLSNLIKKMYKELPAPKTRKKKKN